MEFEIHRGQNWEMGSSGRRMQWRRCRWLSETPGVLWAELVLSWLSAGVKSPDSPQLRGIPPFFGRWLLKSALVNTIITDQILVTVSKPER
jgi:hypothetical protein